MSNNQKFPVYLVYSSWSISAIDEFLQNHAKTIGEEVGSGLIRLVYDSNGKETNRNIVILSDTIYSSLIKNGYDHKDYGRDFLVTPFQLRENYFPSKGKTTNLFVPVPNEFLLNDLFATETILDKLKHLSDWGILPESSFSVKPFLPSREEGKIKGGCFISFKKDVSMESRAMARLLLTDTYWPKTSDVQDPPSFQCFWSRLRKDLRNPVPEKLPPTEEEIKKTKDLKKANQIKSLVNKAVVSKQNIPESETLKSTPNKSKSQTNSHKTTKSSTETSKPETTSPNPHKPEKLSTEKLVTKTSKSAIETTKSEKLTAETPKSEKLTTETTKSEKLTTETPKSEKLTTETPKSEKQANEDRKSEKSATENHKFEKSKIGNPTNFRGWKPINAAPKPEKYKMETKKIAIPLNNQPTLKN